LDTLGQDNFILERASIDELFIDVTKHCNNFKNSVWDTDNKLDTNNTFTNHNQTNVSELFIEGTLIFGQDSIMQPSDIFQGHHELALIQGCQIASRIRAKVYNDLGFTMSAGIAQSKALSKLGASFAKPNGQCVIFPQALPKVNYLMIVKR